MEETLESIEEEKILKLRKELKKLYSVWNEIGIENERKVKRCKTAWGHLIGLLQQMLKEENYFYNILSVRVKELREEISELSKQLEVPCDNENEGTLLVMEEILKKKLSNLKEIKEERMKKFRELRDSELKYCKILDWSAFEISSKTGIPSERDISEMEQYVSALQTERNVRFQRLCTAKRELTTILEETEIQPETSFEREILSSNEDNISLANKTLQTLDDVVKKVRSRKSELEGERESLLKQLGNVWDGLYISEGERNKFLSKHKDHKVSTLQSIKDEIERYEEVKRQKLKKSICDLRELLLSLWKDCFASVEGKENFSLFKSDEFTEESLQAHEAEVEKWQVLYTKIGKLRTKIEKRNELWDLLIEFENKAKDPNRYKNRKGNLLNEEKERKKLGEDLPALENEIFLDIENFEAENGTTFLYHGENYRTAVMKQWEDRNLEKENKKIMRHKERMLQAEHEVTFGTPIVKRTLCTTPRSARCITPKSSSSKFLKSSLGVAVYRTPLASTSRGSPCATAKRSINTKPSSAKKCLLYSTPPRALLKDTAQAIIQSSTNDETTYSVFASALDKSSRRLNSSVLSCKKVVGTRISSDDKCKQKSISKSLRKSTKIQGDVSTKLTPSRGILGLPFLI
ncbi:protein regulator of cytokinesis 1-like [Uloborus diversus]|uniref:protein regulator of cytokinesis 1-like n=1 Tax=Uloborus diversus TaxID=327109 RepID=UPI00240A20DA|nr:protein regulator of cytokinesis 1-like [Uloborus diversus]